MLGRGHNPQPLEGLVEVTDCHVHINPFWEMLPAARATIRAGRDDAERVERFVRDPKAFLAYLDEAHVARAVLINYVSPEVVGYSDRTSDFVLDYVQQDPERLVAVGGVDVLHHPDPAGRIRELAGRGLRGVKLHPPHQLFWPNGHTPDRGADRRLRELYATCQELRLPVTFHTGTSIFPLARNRFADPLLIEDVAVDFPDLTIVLAHGGRPFWTESAMFLARRFPKVFLEVSSIPPEKVLHYFPGLERLADKVLFGSDWPGPGVKDIGDNLRRFRASGLSETALTKILETNPQKVYPTTTAR